MKPSAALHKATTPSRDYLVVVRAGPRSLHPRWAAPERNFDILAAVYDPHAPVAEGEIRVSIPGSKVAGLSKLFAQRPDLLDNYRCIALIDDDIDTDAQGLSTIFSRGAAMHLEIWQPSLTWDSYFSYAVFLQNRRFRLRYVNYVEMMCPFFSAESLRRALPLFGEGWETGIDTVWGRQFDDPNGRCAVLDEVAVTHTRPVGTTKTAQGFAADETYDGEVARFLQSRSTYFAGPVAYSGITADGRKVQTRLGVFFRSAHILSATWRSPLGTKLAAHHLLAHLRHIVTRPRNDSRIL